MFCDTAFTVVYRTGYFLSLIVKMRPGNNWESTCQKTLKHLLLNHTIIMSHPRLLRNGMDASRTMLKALLDQPNQLQFYCHFFIFQPKAIFSRLLHSITNGKYIFRKKKESSPHKKKVCLEASMFFAIDTWMNEWRYVTEICNVQTSASTLQRKTKKDLKPIHQLCRYPRSECCYLRGQPVHL